jgi:hypothetical protein
VADDADTVVIGESGLQKDLEVTIPEHVCNAASILIYPRVVSNLMTKTSLFQRDPAVTVPEHFCSAASILIYP